MYTNPWSNTIPQGSQQAQLIDDFMRQLRLDIYERMNTIVEDWSADPIVLKQPVIAGVVEGKKLIIPHAAGIISESDIDYSDGDGGLEFVGSGGRFKFPILLPPGVTIKKVELLANRGTSPSLTWALKSQSFSSSTVNTLASVVHNGFGHTISDSGDLDIVVSDNVQYWVGVSKTGSALQVCQINALRVTYNTPDSRFTI